MALSCALVVASADRRSSRMVGLICPSVVSCDDSGAGTCQRAAKPDPPTQERRRAAMPRTACASHPDFNRRYRNPTGSTIGSQGAAGSRTITAGSEFHRPRSTFLRQSVANFTRPSRMSSTSAAGHLRPPIPRWRRSEPSAGLPRTWGPGFGCRRRAGAASAGTSTRVEYPGRVDGSEAEGALRVSRRLGRRIVSAGPLSCVISLPSFGGHAEGVFAWAVISVLSAQSRMPERPMTTVSHEIKAIGAARSGSGTCAICAWAYGLAPG